MPRQSCRSRAYPSARAARHDRMDPMRSLLPGFGGSRRRFDSLSAQEILALAISSEEEDSRIYALYASRLREHYPASADVFDAMAEEENGHRRRLIDLYRARYGDLILPIRREHVADFYGRKPVWLVENLGLERIREEAAAMERDAQAFYAAAAARTTDAEVRKLLGDLEAAEAQHEERARPSGRRPARRRPRARRRFRVAKRQFLLTWVQPGLAGLMDGSVSTLAPIFATAFATQNPSTTFLVGLSASLGAGISMGFTEAAHDDGKLFGPRLALEARAGLGRHDRARRPRPCAALSHPAFLDRDGDRAGGGVLRIVGDRLDPASLHGDAGRAGHVPDPAGRRAGARRPAS